MVGSVLESRSKVEREGREGEIDLCNDINLLNKKIRNIFMQTYKLIKLEDKKYIHANI